MFSDGMSGKALVECHKSISENKDNSSDVNNNIFQDCEKVSFELAISKSRGFTQDDREYVNNNFEGKMFSKKIRNLINDVLKLTYSNLPPSTCTTSCGAILNALSDLREYQINEMGIEDPEFCFLYHRRRLTAAFLTRRAVVIVIFLAFIVVGLSRHSAATAAADKHT